jgi:hypothetical protein
MKFKPIIFALCFSWLAMPAFTGEATIPPDLQVSIFKKVFGFDKTIQPGTLKLVVAFTDSSAALKDQVVKAFQESGVPVSAAKEEQLSGALNGVNVLYVTPGIQSAKQLCQKNGILSITGTSSLVESGEASVGLSVLDNKPKIVVHMKQLKAEGHELSANLLQLAKVIQ